MKEEDRLREEVEKILKEVEETDRREDEEYGGRSGREIPEELATQEKRLEAIRKAKAELEREAKEKAEKEQAKRKEEAENKGKTYSPRKDPETAKPKPRDQRSFTDPDSRIMLSGDKAFIQGYNAQAAVDAETQIIVAVGLGNQANDSTYLAGQVEQVLKNTGRCPREVTADAG